MNPPEVIWRWYQTQNVKALAKFFFPSSPCAQHMTPTQEEIIRDIIYSKERIKSKGLMGIDCCAMTQYGKTEAFAVGYNLKILFSKNLKIAIIASKWDKSDPIRNFIVQGIFDNPYLLNLADIDRGGRDRMKKEASKKRQTFKNGCEIVFYNAEGDAQRLMGHGLTKETGIVHIEEAAEIRREAFSKIWRFLIGKFDTALFNLTYNPWDRDTVAFDVSLDEKFKHYHISYEDALKEGRIRQEEIDFFRKTLLPIEFTVLMESKFPEESESQLISLSHIQKAISSKIDLKTELLYLEDILRNPEDKEADDIIDAKKRVKEFKRIISCDPADQGMDRTVIFWGIQKGDKFQVIDHYVEAKTDSAELRIRIQNLADKFFTKYCPNEVRIDAVGIGTGPASELARYFRMQTGYYATLTRCKNGEKAIDTELYKNKKDENYFRLRDLMIEGLIRIPDIKELKKELISLKWQLSMNKREVFRGDPNDRTKRLKGKSPDFADALMYFIWKGRRSLTFAVA